jgi:flagellar biosynthetic protein FliR
VTILDLMAFLLVLARIGGIFAFMPFLGDGGVPAVVKGLLVLIVSLAIFPVTGVHAPAHIAEPLPFFLYLTAEVLFGAFMGFSALIIFKVLRTGGEMIATQMGMDIVFAADPAGDEDSTIFGTMCEMVGVIMFFAVNAHHVMIKAVCDSFATWPLGAFLSPEFLRNISVDAVTRHFAMAFQLAAPIMLLSFFVNVLMAISARLVPEMDILILSFPIRVGVALVGLLMFAPLLVHYSGGVSRMMMWFVTRTAAGG